MSDALTPIGKVFDKIQINFKKRRWTTQQLLEILARCKVNFEASTVSDVETYRINYKFPEAKK